MLDFEAVFYQARHARQEKAFRVYPDSLLPFFLLPSSSEPMHLHPERLAICHQGVLYGVFIYRVQARSAFFGFYLDPAVRGRGLAVPALTAALSYLARNGFNRAWSYVAAANAPSVKMHLNAGFSSLSAMDEWRGIGHLLVNVLDELDPRYIRYEPEPQVLYRMYSRSLPL